MIGNTNDWRDGDRNTDGTLKTYGTGKPETSTPEYLEKISEALLAHFTRIDPKNGKARAEQQMLCLYPELRLPQEVAA